MDSVIIGPTSYFQLHVIRRGYGHTDTVTFGRTTNYLWSNKICLQEFIACNWSQQINRRLIVVTSTLFLKSRNWRLGFQSLYRPKWYTKDWGIQGVDQRILQAECQQTLPVIKFFTENCVQGANPRYQRQGVQLMGVSCHIFYEELKGRSQSRVGKLQ